MATASTTVEWAAAIATTHARHEDRRRAGRREASAEPFREPAAEGGRREHRGDVGADDDSDEPQASSEVIEVYRGHRHHADHDEVGDSEHCEARPPLASSTQHVEPSRRRGRLRARGGLGHRRQRSPSPEDDCSPGEVHDGRDEVGADEGRHVEASRQHPAGEHQVRPDYGSDRRRDEDRSHGTRGRPSRIQLRRRVAGQHDGGVARSRGADCRRGSARAPRPGRPTPSRRSQAPRPPLPPRVRTPDPAGAPAQPARGRLFRRRRRAAPAAGLRPHPTL